MSFSTNRIISDVEDELLEISIDILRIYENDMDKVYLTYSKLKKIMMRLKQDLKRIFNKEDLFC